MSNPSGVTRYHRGPSRSRLPHATCHMTSNTRHVPVVTKRPHDVTSPATSHIRPPTPPPPHTAWHACVHEGRWADRHTRLSACHPSCSLAIHIVVRQRGWGHQRGEAARTGATFVILLSPS